MRVVQAVLEDNIDGSIKKLIKLMRKRDKKPPKTKKYYRS